MVSRGLLAGLCLAMAAPSAAPALSDMRMTPAELQRVAFDGGKAGGSGLAGVSTKVIFGDPTKPGPHAILLFVPVHTSIPAHSHRDDRMATVVSGEWRFGYGNTFGQGSLKALPPGSVYSEPAGKNHFTQTGDAPVIVHLVGYGPTDTRYVDSANDPAKRPKAPRSKG